jgi:acetylornithine deacetylase/succinyl-diaminopimelate desuccinylase-like protein
MQEATATARATRDASLAYARGNAPRVMEELKSFVRIPSVSSQPKHAPDVKRCAEWLANHLRQIGLENVRVIKTPRHPIVYADWLHAPGRPTVLVYGHYDVQPVEPLNEWRTPPFEPIVRGENLYARGACDDKGQLFAHVKALEFYLRDARRLPVNVKCLFEGEEEIGSPHLKPFVARHRRALACDTVVMSDTRMLGPDRPAITYALRGSLSLELEVTGARADLHSGNYGGALHNPLQALCEIIGKLYGPENRLLIPGFYDRVRRWSQQERDYMARVGPRDQEILRQAGTARGWGEMGYTLYERTTVRPALNVTGLTGGHQGAGGKSIVPARAIAKLDLRLVPDQEPKEIERLFNAQIRHLTPATVHASVRTLFRNKPALIDRSHPSMRAAFAAYRQGFGVSPVLVRSGGSIPIVNEFQELLGAPTVLMGFALPDDRIHAPNEKFYLPNFFKGIVSCICFLREVANSLKNNYCDSQLERASRRNDRVSLS